MGLFLYKNPAAYIIPLSVDAFILQKRKQFRLGLFYCLSVSFPNGIYE